MLAVDGRAEIPVVIRAPDDDGPLRGGHSHDGDVRATAVLAVLAGVRAETVAERHDVPREVLDGWIQTFVHAGRERLAAEVDADGPAEADGQSPRDRFLSLVAHELRSPLAMIQGWAELLGDGISAPDVVDRAVAGIGANVARLRRLADDTLDASSVALGRLELHPTVERLDRAVDGVLDARSEQSPRLVVDEAVAVRIDVDRFGQILDNLLDNARKHGDGVASVRIGRQDAFGEVTITSPGEPIPTQVARRMFEPFERGSTDTDGAGLGLYVCQALVVAHGGQIGLRVDEAGNHFWVRFPLHTTGVDQGCADQSRKAAGR